jgi:hypothetical protein
MLARGRYALKEWGSVCQGLGRGDHILLLRKGGIEDARAGFQLEHREFFLFPTRVHEEGGAPPEEVALAFFARVAGEFGVENLERLRRLRGQHGLPEDQAEKRFHYGRHPGLRAFALRVYALSHPHRVEQARRFDGCRSWVELDEDLAEALSGPVLDDAAFVERLEALRAMAHG